MAFGKASDGGPNQCRDTTAGGRKAISRESTARSALLSLTSEDPSSQRLASLDCGGAIQPLAHVLLVWPEANETRWLSQHSAVVATDIITVNMDTQRRTWRWRL